MNNIKDKSSYQVWRILTSLYSQLEPRTSEEPFVAAVEAVGKRGIYPPIRSLLRVD